MKEKVKKFYKMATHDSSKPQFYNGLLRGPGTAIQIVGGSQSGKTSLFYLLWKNKNYVFEHPPLKTFIFYLSWQSIYEEMSQDNTVEFIKGFDLAHMDRIPAHSMICFDDQMQRFSELNVNQITDIWTRRIHHDSLTVVLILQDLYFNQMKSLKTISRNTHYVFLLPNKREKMALMALGRSITPSDPTFLIKATDYIFASSNERKYMLLDVHPHQSNQLPYRSGIFPDEVMTVYLPNK